MHKQTKKYLIISVAVIFAALLAVWLFMPSQVAGVFAKAEVSSHAETPFGEYLDIKLGTSAQTSQASWQASTASASQNVWTVNSTYKSQALVTLGYSLQVSYANVQNIQIVSLYIKAVDSADSSSYTYTLASAKSLSGSSPITDSDSMQKSISTHLSEVAASAPCSIKYYIYCKVQAQGAISGQTLVAEVTETWFCTLNYAEQTESTSATVTPSVNVASWADWLPKLDITDVAALGLFCAIIVLALIDVRDTKKRGGRK